MVYEVALQSGSRSDRPHSRLLRYDGKGERMSEEHGGRILPWRLCVVVRGGIYRVVPFNHRRTHPTHWAEQVTLPSSTRGETTKDAVIT